MVQMRDGVGLLPCVFSATVGIRFFLMITHGFCRSLRRIPSKNIALVLLSGLFLFGCSGGGGSPDPASTDEASSTDPGTPPRVNPVVVMGGNAKSTCVLESNRVVCLRIPLPGPPAVTIEVQEIAMPPQAASTITAIDTNGSQNGNGCVIRDGRVICWGINLYDDFTQGSQAYSVAEGRYVKNLPDGASSVSIGDDSACAIFDGAAKCWGSNNYGQLGNGSRGIGFAFASPEGLSSGVSVIRVGGLHACAIVNGAAKCWGENDFKVLGFDATATNPYVPTQVQGLESGVKAISAGHQHNCAVVSTKAMCWGQNTRGQLGNGGTINQPVPVPVLMPGASPQVEAVSVGFEYSCAVTNGRAMCWGRNDHGQLGNGNTTDQHKPTEVQGLEGRVTAVSLSNFHSCAVVDDDVFCWGKHGNSPDPTLLPVTPTQVTLPPIASET